jgi:cell division septum initiation protein DivIVA
MSPFHDSNPATISALAAIFGSLTGALASSVSTWITQRHQDQRDLLAKRIFHREQLYSDFISETARALADAMQHNFQDLNKLVPTYAVLSRIRVSSSTDVLASAERVVDQILSTYSEPNLTSEEIQSRAAAKGDDPLRDFSTICRGELESLWKVL